MADLLPDEKAMDLTSLLSESRFPDLILSNSNQLD